MLSWVMWERHLCIVLYSTKFRGKKWYHRTAFHLMSLVVVHAFVIYRKTCGNGSSDFLTSIRPYLTAGDILNGWL